jgi:hypothetical protein
MISSYYSKGCDSKELFSGLKISKVPEFEDKLNKYNVIKIDLNSEYQNIRDKNHLIKSVENDIKLEIQKEYPNILINEDDTLAKSILKVYSDTNEPFVIIIDEYDVLIREDVDDSLFNEYLSFLNGLFKSATLRPAISLAYLTGILPIVRDKVQSKLNNFVEYTILDAAELSEYIGFTSQEIIELCEDYNMDYNEMKSWYDGYSQNGYEIYNPESVVRSIQRKKYMGFWSQTSTYHVILDRLKANYEGMRDDVIQMLSGESIDVDVYGYKNVVKEFINKDDIYAYLIHIGYLAYNEEDKTCFIPNKEVRFEWIRAVAAEPEYKNTDKIIKASKELLKETIAGNTDAVAKALDESHINVTSNRSYNNEDALQSAIYLAYIYAINKYFILREVTAGKGYADVVFVPIKEPTPATPAMVIELKRNDCTESAINQIKEKKYFKALEGYEGKLLFVGINYDEKEKTHTAQIEEFDM